MDGSEWAERIIVVDAYLKAQYALMHSATSGEVEAEILRQLDDVRRRRVAFTQFSPSIFQEASRFSTTAVEEAIADLQAKNREAAKAEREARREARNKSKKEAKSSNNYYWWF